MIKLRTSGACVTCGEFNGCGGYAFSVTSNPADFEDSGHAFDTTCNRMEIEAVIQGLKQIAETKKIFLDKEESEIKVFSSELIVKTHSGEYRMKENKDKWQELFMAIQKLESNGFTVKFIFEKGKNIPEKKCVDNLAKKAMEKGKNLLAIEKMKSDIPHNV